jgi:hypothetical protein
MSEPAEDLAARTTQQVYEDHLRLAADCDFEADLARNVAADFVAR